MNWCGGIIQPTTGCFLGDTDSWWLQSQSFRVQVELGTFKFVVFLVVVEMFLY